jgi:omega-amidase
MKDLRVTLVQTSLYWEDIQANLLSLDEKLKSIQFGSTDLVILPEMFPSGFSMNAEELYQEMDGQAIYWMKEIAAAKNAVVTGSIIIKEHNHYFNRLVWMRPEGTYETYDKRHLFCMANEQLTFSHGDKKLIVELKGWKICPLICYDLRFPVWSRNVENEYDCLIYIANWPEKRNYAWKQLLVARAIENQSYVVGLNRVGKDGKDLEYSGDSVLVNCKGEEILKLKPNTEQIETINLSYQSLEEFRKIFPVVMDADNFKIITKENE